MKFIWLSSLIFFNVLGDKVINQDCITPHGVIGTCIEITSCPHIYTQVVTKPKSISLRKYARQAYCGDRKGVPLVCCGPEEKIYEECGVIGTFGPRIYGGKPVKNHLPWMAALEYKEPGDPNPEFRCQGFLINSQFVLTAAHCLKAQPIHKVHLGSSDLSRKDNGLRKMEILNISYHAEFRGTSDDIGLIRIAPMKYTDNTRWICLPYKDSPLPDWFTIRGWGKNDRMVKMFTTPLQTRIRITPYNECPFAQNRNLLQNRIVCAGGEVHVDSCDGDSGGPLMNKTRYEWTAYGIVSWGSGDCSRGDPAIYTRLQYYRDWMEKTMIEMLNVNKTT